MEEFKDKRKESGVSVTEIGVYVQFKLGVVITAVGDSYNRGKERQNEGKR